MSRRPRPYSSLPAVVPRGRSAGLPPELTRPIATTHDGRDITRPYTGEIEEFRDQRLQGELDWGVYDRILMDDQVKSCLEQRRSAVVSREWSVLPGDGEDPRSVAAAAALEANLQQVGWDQVTDKMLYAPFYGVAYAELSWGTWQFEGRTLWGWVATDRMKPIHVRHARRFRRDKEGRLRLLTATNMVGEIMPERKFWSVTAGASDDDQPYGHGLADWLYWPTLFKRNGIRFWNIFLDKFSIPPVKGSYPRGTSAEEVQKLLQSMMALANDSGIAVPEGVVIDFMQVATNGISFEKMPEYMDEAIAKIILSQTMTTQDGASLSQAKVHGGVKQELITSDADLLTESFTCGPARWFTDFNFGADVAAPIVTRQVEEEEDTERTAKTDETLARIGFVRTDESFRDLYGEGFERRALPTPPEDDPALPGKEKQLRLPAPTSFAEGSPLARDIVDDAVDQIMADEGWAAVHAPIVRLVGELAAAASREEVEAILRREADLADEAPLTESLASGTFFIRMAAASGADGAEG